VPPTELIEAAKGGLETLAAYLRGLAEAEPTGPRTLWMSSMQVLDYIKKRKANHATENAADEGSPEMRPRHSPEPTQHGTAEPDIVERAYDPGSLERQLKMEAMIDGRIAKGLARLVGLKEYKKLYGQKIMTALPSASSPPLAASGPVIEISVAPVASATSETVGPKALEKRKWGDPN
jgi:hypothetical protein